MVLTLLPNDIFYICCGHMSCASLQKLTNTSSVMHTAILNHAYFRNKILLVCAFRALRADHYGVQEIGQPMVANYNTKTWSGTFDIQIPFRQDGLNWIEPDAFGIMRNIHEFVGVNDEYSTDFFAVAALRCRKHIVFEQHPTLNEIDAAKGLQYSMCDDTCAFLEGVLRTDPQPDKWIFPPRGKAPTKRTWNFDLGGWL